MPSEVGICNRALQKLGAKLIVSLSDNSTNAQAVSTCYYELRDSTLRDHRWNFAIKRATLPADPVAPAWGRPTSCQLPSDFLKLIDPYPEMDLPLHDWVIEGQKILTFDTPPLDVRYIAKITDPNLMDPLFREALAARMALEMCEALTQSNTKKAALGQDYRGLLANAKAANAIEVVPQRSPEDRFLYMRR